MDSSEHVCPVCGQPVETVIRRHKTLGAWVPRWVAGPCHNPACEAYVPEDPQAPERPERHGGSETGIGTVTGTGTGTRTGTGEEPGETAAQTS